jgi:hypothetical protein
MVQELFASLNLFNKRWFLGDYANVSNDGSEPSSMIALRSVPLFEFLKKGRCSRLPHAGYQDGVIARHMPIFAKTR